jgi:hypothetical protein
MSDARQRLSRMPTTLRDRSDSRTSNTRGEPHSRSPFTTGWQPVRPREQPYQVLLVRSAKSLRTAGRAASSRRQGHHHDLPMQTTPDGRSSSIRSPTNSGPSIRVCATGWNCVVPPTPSTATTRNNRWNTRTARRLRMMSGHFHLSTHFGGVPGGSEKRHTPPSPSRTRVSMEVSNV